TIDDHGMDGKRQRHTARPDDPYAHGVAAHRSTRQADIEEHPDIRDTHGTPERKYDLLRTGQQRQYHPPAHAPHDGLRRQQQEGYGQQRYILLGEQLFQASEIDLMKDQPECSERQAYLQPQFENGRAPDKMVSMTE